MILPNGRPSFKIPFSLFTTFPEFFPKTCPMLSTRSALHCNADKACLGEIGSRPQCNSPTVMSPQLRAVCRLGAAEEHINALLEMKKTEVLGLNAVVGHPVSCLCLSVNGDCVYGIYKTKCIHTRRKVQTW